MEKDDMQKILDSFNKDDTKQQKSTIAILDNITDVIKRGKKDLPLVIAKYLKSSEKHQKIVVDILKSQFDINKRLQKIPKETTPLDTSQNE